MFTASGYGVGKGQIQSAPIRGIAGKLHHTYIHKTKLTFQTPEQLS